MSLPALIAQNFDLNELKLLCADLHIEYEDLEGTTRSVKALSLVQYCQRRGRLRELVTRCRQLRGSANWPDPDTLDDAPREWNFPGDRSAPLEKIPTQIPPAKAARLVGRADDLKWLRQRLQTGGGQAALAGVRGIGGIGKTELAIAIANEMKDDLPGGVIWLAAGANDLAAIQEQMARHLGLPELPDGADLQARADALALALQPYPRALVVVDDVRDRHIPDFDRLKPPAPHALLVTSRHADLPLPPGGLRRVDTLEPAAAQALLADVLDPAWVEAEPDEMAAIAELLEGIPLALWLAGRRAWVIAGRSDGSGERPLVVLHRELEERKLLALHESPKRADLSVLVTFDLSYAELDGDGQRRLAQLGVFAQGVFPLDGLAMVWGAEETEQVQEWVKPLANAGLLEEVANGWWMHDLLREYSGEKLKKQLPEVQTNARLGHAAFIQEYLDHLPRLSLADWEALAALLPEAVQAANWLLAEGQWQNAPRLAAALAWSLDNQFQLYQMVQGQGWLENGLKAAETDQWEMGIGVLGSKLAALLSTRGQYEGAERLYRESLAVFEKVGDSRSVAVTQSSLAALLSTRGQYEEAERLYRESLAVKEKVGDSREVAVTQSSLADLLSTRGQYEEAERLYRESLAVFEKVGDSREVAVTQVGMADLLVVRENYKEAQKLYETCLETCQKLQDWHSVGAILVRLGQLFLTTNRQEEAQSALLNAKKIFQEMRATNWLAAIDELLAQLQDSFSGAAARTETGIALAELVQMVQAGRAGDRQKGEEAFNFLTEMALSGDAETAVLARALRLVLLGDAPQKAVAGLPEAVRRKVLALLG